MKSHCVNDIQKEFAKLYLLKDYVVDKSGVKTIEIIGASFVADEASIFGEVNIDYAERELEWYNSMSLNVNDIPGKIPAIWKQVADEDGFINSNYGWCAYSEENYSQYDWVLRELRNNPESRRAQMIYTRPSMNRDYNKNGRSDFMCCSNVVYQIRDAALVSHVFFRSNDAIFGYRNDFYWMNHVHQKLALELDVAPGLIYWNSASLHIYERHFNLVENYIYLGKIS